MRKNGRTSMVLQGLKQIELEGMEVFDTDDIIAACSGPIRRQQIHSAISPLYKDGYIGKIKQGKYFLKPEFMRLKIELNKPAKQSPLFPEPPEHQEPPEQDIKKQSRFNPDDLGKDSMFYLLVSKDGTFKGAVFGDFFYMDRISHLVDEGDMVVKVCVESVKTVVQRFELA